MKNYHFIILFLGHCERDDSKVNKKIVLVETVDFIKNRFKEIAREEGDILYFLEAENRDNEDEKLIIKCDLKSNYNDAKKIIEEVVGNPDVIMTVNESFLTQTARLAEEFKVYTESLDAVYANRDKFEMKKVWMNSGVPTAKSKLYKSLKEVEDDINYINFPVIIKPSQGYASMGVKKVDSKEELISQASKIFLLNFTVVTKEKLNNTGILIEDYIDGEEFSVDTLWVDGKPIVSGILARGIPKGPYYPDRLYFIDTELSENECKRIKDASYDAVRATGLKSSATHTELRYKNDDIFVIETTSRPGGGGYFYEHIFKQGYGIDFTKLYYYINVIDDKEELFNRLSKVELNTGRNACLFMYNVPYKNKGIIKAVHGVEKLKARSEIIECTCFKKAGDILYEEDMNAGYLVWLSGKIENKNIRKELERLQDIYDEAISVEYKSS